MRVSQGKQMIYIIDPIYLFAPPSIIEITIGSDFESFVRERKRRTSRACRGLADVVVEVTAGSSLLNLSQVYKVG